MKDMDSAQDHLVAKKADTPWVSSCVKSSFSLIELLVVISILSVLSSLLGPSMSKIQKMGESILCTQRMGHVGGLLSYYAEDFNNKFPVNAVTEEAWIYDISWDDLLVSYDGRSELLEEDWRIFGNRPNVSSKWNRDPVDHFEYKTYLCPSDRTLPDDLSKTRRSFSLTSGIDPIDGKDNARPGIVKGGGGAYAPLLGTEWSMTWGQITRPSTTIIASEYNIEDNCAGYSLRAVVMANNLDSRMHEESYWVHDLWMTSTLLGDGSSRQIWLPDTYLDVTYDWKTSIINRADDSMWDAWR